MRLGHPVRRPLTPLIAALTWAAAAAGCGCGAGSRPGSDRDAPFASRREEMVAQIAARGVEAPAVLAAMRAVPRHRFVLPADEALAYDDHPLGIAAGQTISQPYIVAFMTAAIELAPGDRVLEVGTGSGYQAAVLARIAREVYSIEIVPELSRRAAHVLRELGYSSVRLRVGDGYLGWPEAAPFDAIMLTAATPEVPAPLLEQLAEGGRLVAPIQRREGQELVLWRRRAGRLETRELLPVRFVPMTGRVRR